MTKPCQFKMKDSVAAHASSSMQNRESFSKVQFHCVDAQCHRSQGESENKD